MRSYAMTLGLLVVGSGCALDGSAGQSTDVDVVDEALRAGIFIPAGYHGIDLGAHHACVLDACQGMRCWGRNDWGQATVPTGPRWQKVAAGAIHTCGLTTSGEVRCWGNNTYNQINAPAGSNFVDIDAGPTHSCAVDDRGTPHCWGQIVTPPSSLSGVTTGVASGNQFTCAEYLDTRVGSNLLSCWGGGSIAPASTWFVSPLGATPPHGTSAGRQHACTLRGSELLCWGDNFYGQVDGTGLNPQYPDSPFASRDEEDPAGTHVFPRTASGYGWTQVAAGYYHTCGINDLLARDLGKNTNLHCFGSDAFNESSGVPQGNFTDVSLGAHFTCGVHESGKVLCWGRNLSGETNPNTPSECEDTLSIATPWKL